MRYLITFLLFVCSNVFADLYYETYYGTGAYPNMPYYGTGQLTYPTVLSSGTVTAINHDWGGGAVLNSGQSERVLVKYWGYIYVPGSGSQTLTFYNSSDDGFYLRLNNQVVINDWQEQGPAYYNGAGSITLTGGQYYYLEAWYYENGGGAVSRLYWNQTGSIQIVPTSSYYLTEPIPETTTTTGTSLGPTSTQATIKSSAQTRRDSYSGNDNGIYIDQAGSNNTISILQDSNNNQIRGINQQRAKMWGDNNTYDIRQGATTSVGINLIELMVDGDSNNLTLYQDRSDDGGQDSSAYGDHIIRANVDGNLNDVSVIQRNNTTYAEGHFVELDVIGNSNIINFKQISDYGKDIFANITGNSNSLTILQNDNSRHFADITLTGDGHSVNLTQSGTGAHRATIDLTYGSASSTLNLNQLGSTSQSFSLEQTCYTAGGCSTTLTQQ